ncbi:LysR family transcriptional regulator [Nitrosomonas supralitoralis]|uniref:LysR family transcriptional regulator n=1 Tax=Nitrosomonas supralitoralis TaxID=2116706 RepID=A0A2P7NT61_9PROT|nr:LysR family transcriptional regulator [Nitrosomonas supralitoralis]PSJ16618.1 LysR family transcriptional regulator [Nitrosomonas supralitoralis]
MRHSTLRQLEVFEAIARLKSFTRAAEELFLTQPTVSMQIKKLTQEIGLPLFEQVGKKIYLTDAGTELYKTCLGIFDHFSRFEMIASDMKGMKSGKLRIAVVTTAKYFTPRLLGMFCQKYPNIDVALKVTNREHILERLTGNQDDLYILGQIPDAVDAVAEIFLDNPLVVLASADHPLANEKKITIERICDEPFIMREPGSGTRIATEHFFSGHNKKLKVRMELGSNEAIKQTVAGRLGIAVLSRHTLRLDAQIGQLAILDVVGFPIERHWYFAYSSGKQLSIVAQTFLNYLREAADLLEDLSCRHGTSGHCPLLKNVAGISSDT